MNMFPYAPYGGYDMPGTQYEYSRVSYPAEQTMVVRVPDFATIESQRVPLDGRVVYFILNDNSAICTKFIDMNGNAVIRKYVLQEIPSSNKTFEERIANLEAIVSQMKGADTNVSTANGESAAGSVQSIHESATS